MASLPDDELRAWLTWIEASTPRAERAAGGWRDDDPSRPSDDPECPRPPEDFPPFDDASALAGVAFANAFDDCFGPDAFDHDDPEPAEPEPTQWFGGRLVHLN